jgi:PAS domain S-box-containing protein
VLLIAGIYIALYLLLGWLSYARPVLKPAITPWNPQAGLTLALLLAFGPRYAIATAIAVLLHQEFIHGEPGGMPLLAASAIWIAVVYGGLAVALQQWGLSGPIRTALAAARLAGAAVVATGLAAAGYVFLFIAGGEIPIGDAARGIARFWLGDLNGVLMLAPLLIQMSEWRGSLDVVRSEVPRVFAQLAVVLATMVVLFYLPAADQLRFFYLLFVPVIWIALRWGLSGAVFSVLAIEVGLMVAARAGIHTPRFIDLQMLLLTLALTALLLGAVVVERADILRQVAHKESEQRALFAMSPDGVMSVDAEGSIQLANAAATRLFGDRAMQNPAMHLETLLPDLRLRAAQGRATLTGKRGDGTEFPAEIAWAQVDPASTPRFLVTVRDATERLEAEQQLRERDAALARAMRFAVAGELASALAHELNQPITALVSYLRASEILAARPAVDEGRLRDTLGKSMNEAIRASEVLRRLRDFYSSGTFKRERIDLTKLCAEAVSAFQERLRRAEATLSTRVDDGLPVVVADGTQLEVVLHNLLANAIDAVKLMPAERRRIELQASAVDGVMLVRVEDSGPGISSEVSQSLFEPFVTSKPDGMGLGLAISRSLIRARGGELSCAASDTLGGASFTLRLPLEIPANATLV